MTKRTAVTKHCKLCNYPMTYRLVQKTYDDVFGPAYYCNRESCRYRESVVPQSDVDLSHLYVTVLKKMYTTRNRLASRTQITPYVTLGDLCDVWDLQQRSCEYHTILNVSNETYTPPPDVTYIHIPIDEFASSLIADVTRRKNFLAAVHILNEHAENHQSIFVHCAFGANRSPAVVMAHLICQGYSLPEAYEHVKSLRPIVYPHGAVCVLLHDFAKYYTGESSPAVHARRTISEKEDEDSETESVPPEQFLEKVNWDVSFETNYSTIVGENKPPEEVDLAVPLFLPKTETSKRFVRADILISQALEHYRAQNFPPAEKGQVYDVFAARKETLADVIPRIPPEQAYRNILSRRGIVLPAPHVFNNEKYQRVYNSTSTITVDANNPKTLSDTLKNFDNFYKQHFAKHSSAYVRVPTNFGGDSQNHIAYASWFAIMSAHTAVEVEEVFFVLWLAGQSSDDPLRFGLMPLIPRTKYWLEFLQWAGFPRYDNLYRVLDGLDTSDESYMRRLQALSRLRGFQPKVSSFFLALIGDVRSPTLDMHAIGYLLDNNKLELPVGASWTDTQTLSEMYNMLVQMYNEAEKDKEKLEAYKNAKKQYDIIVEKNNNTIAKVLQRFQVGKTPPATARGAEQERERLRNYIKAQFVGWDGSTDTFWGWYASNPNFETHEPRRNMIHTVFFQSLFPELFTPEALAARPWVVELNKEDVELAEHDIDRMRYRDYVENLKQMREIQKPHLSPTEPPPVEQPMDVREESNETKKR